MEKELVIASIHGHSVYRQGGSYLLCNSITSDEDEFENLGEAIAEAKRRLLSAEDDTTITDAE
jgi:hypothetical protein